MTYVNEATENTSPLPDLLKDATETDEMKSVLRIVKDNEDYAQDLAKAILKSKTAEEVGAAFADIAFQA
jgi:hypothetical protein